MVMPLPARRISAILAAVAVFVMSLDCACGGAMEPANPGRAPAMAQMPCCAGEHERHHHDCAHQHGDHSQPCDKTCEHCQQAVMNDSVSASPATILSVSSWLPIVGSNPMSGLRP